MNNEHKSAFFQVQKRRIETVGEAFDRFARQLAGPEMVEHVASMLESENSELWVTIKVRPDARTAGCVIARMTSAIVTQTGEENLYGLNPDPVN